MQTISAIADLRALLRAWRREGRTIGFVPTMGNLHEGHLTLVREARRHADKVVVSIFVNPMQFDRAEDLARYPRTEEQDAALLRDAGADLLFLPTVETIYPRPMASHTFVEVPELGSILEGAARPGHFRGVATIVSKLFNLVQPDVACFGQKDYQQLALLRRMTSDLGYPIQIIGVPTVRASDGLALSSRNGYLTADERQRAPLLAKVMAQLAAEIARAGADLVALSEAARAELDANGFRTDVIDIVDAETLEPLSGQSREAVILMAAWLGAARLIDNTVVALSRH
ncbi:MAG: pantoate--beta-alanine ligase [Gammaproteobacteria bacterium]|nr:pantoate--beta-alanine ligase [Gammaproteobacteria bacterium]